MAWFTTLEASTKRSSMSAGKKGPAATYLTSVAISPPDPVDPERRGEIKKGLDLETPNALMECFVDEVVDILASDRLVINDKEYVVRGVATWPKVGSLNGYMRLILEDLATLA